jgi:hypothetical protein
MPTFEIKCKHSIVNIHEIHYLSPRTSASSMKCVVSMMVRPRLSKARVSQSRRRAPGSVVKQFTKKQFVDTKNASFVSYKSVR